MNVLVASSFGVIKDIFRSTLKQLTFVQDVKLINPTEIKSLDLSRKNRIDSSLDLIIYDLDTTCCCPNKKIRHIEEVMKFSISKGNNGRILFISSEAQLTPLQENLCFIQDYMIIKPFRLKDVIHKVKDMRVV
ncbi:hypothetical protein ACEUAY_21570 [Aeromonas veronii]